MKKIASALKIILMEKNSDVSFMIILLEPIDTKSVRSTALQKWNLEKNSKDLLFQSIILFSYFLKSFSGFKLILISISSFGKKRSEILTEVVIVKRMCKLEDTFRYTLLYKWSKVVELKRNNFNSYII